MFDLPNRIGLSELLRGKADFSTIIRKKDETLFVVTSGKLPPNPVELLASELMEGFLDYISNLVDVVIIDSPPTVVTDPVVISSKVDGVLLIIYPGQTKLNSLKLALDQLEHAGARLIGLVFNRISRHNSYYYQYYYPDYYYQVDEDLLPESKEDKKRVK
jgi:capsular exopolysaccharide synthesis family protein